MIKEKLRNIEKIGDISPNVWKAELENIKRERAEVFSKLFSFSRKE